MCDENYMHDDMDMDSDDDDLDELEDDDEEDESMNDEEGMRSVSNMGGGEGSGVNGIGAPRANANGSGIAGGVVGAAGVGNAAVASSSSSSSASDAAAVAAGGAAGEEDVAIARRRAIQAIMRDASLSEQEKRMRIQNLMSGGRTEVTPPTPVSPLLPTSDPSGIACVHYERNCQIVAPCCNRVFGCRICHDELSPNGHAPMNRFAIREVMCKHCHTRQPASNMCVQCNTVFGEYHCDVCNLWMALNKKPFHCNQCGFCRVGGQDAFQHCDECCMCISVTVFATHQCFKDKYKNNCPVCREDMFSSRQSPQDLPCGHAIHAHCFRKLAGFDYRCPICKKTVVSQQSMAAAWEARARDIAEHPMPADLQRVVDIMCNDCETKSHRRNWHFLGIQCPCCNSFNTVVEQVLSSGGGDDQTRNNATQA